MGHESHCSGDLLKDSEPYLPTRLLYVGDNDSSVLRLEDTCSPDFALPGAQDFALSYCRSKNGLLVSQKLTLDKRDEWKSQINEKELPLTFQYAIHLTRKLELKYLWVDALCIAQDCAQDQKLASESMGKVFANAHCTIATFVDADGGCSTKRTSSLLDFPCYLRFSKKKAMTIRANRQAYNSESFAEEVDRNTLNWQAQGFQERLLSRRILHFGPKSRFFECNTHIASEAMTAGQPFREKQWVWEQWKRKKIQPHGDALHSIFNPVNGYRNTQRPRGASPPQTVVRARIKIYQMQDDEHFRSEHGYPRSCSNDPRWRADFGVQAWSLAAPFAFRLTVVHRIRTNEEAIIGAPKTILVMASCCRGSQHLTRIMGCRKGA